MKRRLWPWFLLGFIATFLVLATTLNVVVMLPDGLSTTSLKLWRYYLIEWPQAFSSQDLGPASINQDALVPNTLQHLVLSAGGGLIATVLAWLLQRRSSKSA